MRNDSGAAARRIVLSDVDVPQKDDREAEISLADRRERFSRCIGTDFAEAPHPLDLGRLQNREHLVPSSF
jgi:hypothetical protein